MADARELGCGARAARICMFGVARRSRAPRRSPGSERIVPVDAVIVFCADRWYYERERMPGAERSPTVLVNVAGENVGGPMRVDQVNSIVGRPWPPRRAGADGHTAHAAPRVGDGRWLGSRIWRS